jgi:DNA-binding Xre family transcriptional regulator
MIEDILEERGKNYGEFSNQAEISQELKQVIYLNVGKLEAFKLEALEMICHKIARIINGDSNYIDSWRDISGYSTLVVKQLESTVEKAKEEEVKGVLFPQDREVTIDKKWLANVDSGV